MKSIGTALVILSGMALASEVSAAIPERYQTIIDRNAFGLNPPPVIDPGKGTETNTPPSTVKVSGFAKVNGKVRAFFVIPSKDPKESPRYLNLSPGERDGILEVVDISEDEGKVTVKNSGVEMVLSLKDNNMNPTPTLAPGVKAVPTVMPPAPGVPGAAAQNSPVYNPAAAASVVANYNTIAPAPQLPQAPQLGAVAPNQPGSVGMHQQPLSPNGQQPVGTPASTMRTIPTRGGTGTPVPTRTLRLPPVPGSPQSSVTPSHSGVVFAGNTGLTPTYNNPTPAVVDPAAQYVNMIVKYEADQRAGRPSPPPPPPPPGN